MPRNDAAFAARQPAPRSDAFQSTWIDDLETRLAPSQPEPKRPSAQVRQEPCGQGPLLWKTARPKNARRRQKPPMPRNDATLAARQPAHRFDTFLTTWIDDLESRLAPS